MRPLRSIFKRRDTEDARMTKIGYKRLLSMTSAEPLSSTEPL